MNTTTTPQQPAAIATGCPDLGIYVACLASYNNGRLHGHWIDLAEIADADDMQDCISYILATSPEPGAEEWAIHDNSGLPACLRGEWESLADLAAFAEVWNGLDDDDTREAYVMACDDAGEVVSDSDFWERYQGCHESVEDYTEELAEELGYMEDARRWPFNNIDWRGAWQDLTYDGYFSAPCASGGVHIFRNF